MAERERDWTPPAPAPATAAPVSGDVAPLPLRASLAGASVAQRAAALGALQASAGNRAVARAVTLSRAPAAPAAPAAAAQAAAEAEAVETIGRLRTRTSTCAPARSCGSATRPSCSTSRATQGQGHRMRAEPMTLRSDSAQLVTDRADNAASAAYFFRGIRQDNELKHGPTTLGTINGTTLLVRGRGSSGTWQPEDDIVGTFVHEASHVLVADYGEHPGTKTDAGSFDRYKDEFRAYFVEPSFVSPGRGRRACRRDQVPAHRERRGKRRLPGPQHGLLGAAGGDEHVQDERRRAPAPGRVQPRQQRPAGPSRRAPARPGRGDVDARGRAVPDLRPVTGPSARSRAARR